MFRSLSNYCRTHVLAHLGSKKYYLEQWSQAFSPWGRKKFKPLCIWFRHTNWNRDRLLGVKPSSKFRDGFHRLSRWSISMWMSSSSLPRWARLFDVYLFRGLPCQKLVNHMQCGPALLEDGCHKVAQQSNCLSLVMKLNSKKQDMSRGRRSGSSY